MLSFVVAAALAAVPSAPERGVSEALARARAWPIRDLRYDVVLRIPGDRVRPVEGRVVVRFTLRVPTDVVLDFAQAAERVRAVRSGDREVPFTARNGHIVVAADVTRAGENAIRSSSWRATKP